MSGKIFLVVLMLLYFDDFIVDRKNVKIILSYNDFGLRNWELAFCKFATLPNW